MDGHQFDDLTRTLASGTSRRRVLKGIGGAAAAGAFTLLGMKRSDAAPRCRELGKPCQSDAQCCDRACTNFKCACPVGSTACNNVCLVDTTFLTDEGNCGGCGIACSAGETCCNGVCQATETDETNCGTCGRVCIPGAVCAGGECFCPTGTAECHGSCVALTSFQSDRNNCGFCGNVCPSGGNCISGRCCSGNLVTCPAGCSPGQFCPGCCSGFCFGDGRC